MANKEYWDTLWKDFDLQGEGPESSENEYLTPEIRRVYRNYLPKGNIFHLDAGCGLGNWNFLLHRFPGMRITVGVDISDCLVASEKYRRGQDYRKIGFFKGDILKLPFKEEAFDFITCLGVIEHFERPQVPLLELYRLLKPGGVLFLDTPNHGAWEYYNRLFPIDEHEDYYSPQELVDIMDEVGMKVSESYAKGFSNSIMTPLYQLYNYNKHSMFSRGYHFTINQLKRALKLLDPWLDSRHGFYSIVVATKIDENSNRL